MKKILVLLLVAVLVFGTFAGCGGSTDTEETATPAPTQSETDTPETDTPATEAPLSGKIATGGSTSVEHVIQSFMEAFMEANSDVDITYAPTGSSTGVQGAIDKTLDIGLASRGLKDEEIEQGVEAVVFAYDGIAIIVNKDNPVQDLDMETLAMIAKGEITNWSEVGGNDGEIVFIGRDAASGTRAAFEEIVDVEEMCVYAEEQASTGAVLASVLANANGIGYVSLSSVDETITVLDINGVTPSENTVKDDTYPIARPFNFVLNTEVENPLVDAFLAWAISPATTEMVRNAESRSCSLIKPPQQLFTAVRIQLKESLG